jgi:hypothetical protein
MVLFGVEGLGFGRVIGKHQKLHIHYTPSHMGWSHVMVDFTAYERVCSEYVILSNFLAFS